MALTRDKVAALEELVCLSLNRAEEVWRDHGQSWRHTAAADSALVEKAEIVRSQIPDYPFVDGDNPTIGKFIALVADMRNSSKHLLCAISEKAADASQLQRVYYETSALLPALEQTVKYKGGSVTEYLGDGILALFHIKEDDDEEEAIMNSYRAASNCISQTRIIVNKELDKRYRLPNLDIGIGLAYSKALVSLVGIEGARHPKVIGECVYRATKLSGGKNEVYADERLESLWPQTKGGRLAFRKHSFHGVDGFLITDQS